MTDMFFKNRTFEDSNRYFIGLLDEHIDLFGEAVAEKLEEEEHRRLSDDDFVECYVDGMHRLISKLYDCVAGELRNNYEEYRRFTEVLSNPSRYGFRFKNEEMTIGKIYLYYIWGKTRRKASKSECIKIEKYAVGQGL